MVDPPLRTSTQTKNKLPLGWILTLVFVMFFLWIIYTALQTQTVRSNNGSMSGMNQIQADVTTTAVPDDMSGMNH